MSAADDTASRAFARDQQPRTLRAARELEPRLSPADEAAIADHARASEAHMRREAVLAALRRIGRDLEVVEANVGKVSPGAAHRSGLRAVRHHLAALRNAL